MLLCYFPGISLGLVQTKFPRLWGFSSLRYSTTQPPPQRERVWFKMPGKSQPTNTGRRHIAKPFLFAYLLQIVSWTKCHWNPSVCQWIIHGYLILAPIKRFTMPNLLKTEILSMPRGLFKVLLLCLVHLTLPMKNIHKNWCILIQLKLDNTCK